MASILKTIPKLRMGDKLTLEQFLEYWEDSPEIKRAELIGGIVYMPSPVGERHGSMEVKVAAWLAVYMAHTPGCSVGNNTTTIMDENSPQPDVHLQILPEFGGKTSVAKGLLQEAPELIAEVCVSSTSYDLHQKLEVYQKAGVNEYLAVLMKEQEIRWHRLVDGRYQLIPADGEGIWRSQVFRGLWLDGKALLEDNLAGVLAK